MAEESLREKALGLPLLPGVYIMSDKSGEVIYVGKAKALKNRVSSYFHGAHAPKVELMISHIATFDVIIANSEFEALVLENSLIKRHMPKYNIRLRDDKGHPFIRVDTREQYPRFTVASKMANDGARYLGPYGSRSVTHGAIDAVCKALKLPTCSRRFPRDIGKERPCLNFHMGACRAYCRPEASPEEHREAIDAAIAILDGKAEKLVARLTQEMEEAAEALRFEIAVEKRDRLRAVQGLREKQVVISGMRADSDVIGFFRGAAKSCFVVLHFIEGRLLSKDFELLETPLEDDGEALSGLVRLYYTYRGAYPKNIYLPAETQDVEELERFFTEDAGRRVSVAAPQRGDKRKLIETANINAREETERATTREEKMRKSIEWLQKAMALENPPLRMEAYDISNTGASDIVSSMTVFVNGKPSSRDYKRFKIKSIDMPDDYASMAETVTRRVQRFLDGDAKFAPLPDVFLIDGGMTHARAARNALNALGVTLPVYGMVKDDRHRTRALVSPDGAEIGIAANPAVFALIGTIQEETHRFAIDFHRQLRSGHLKKSKLDEIEGVGEKRRAQLLKSFGSLKAIRAATVDELAAAVGKSVAGKVFAFFHAADSASDETENNAEATDGESSDENLDESLDESLDENTDDDTF
ncbi:MAG: excinuclease ABC subunit UvrC [Oscillospiraceae bacterium]|jgi:excinuclease ABC subunit C|nr:excinuclease ABC subunit UvrC [Oscillospiraceae bacterium]